MFEYFFFDHAIRDKFIARAKQHDVPCTVADDIMGQIVSIPEDITEDAAKDLDDYYDKLELEQADRSSEEGDLNRIAGFYFNLPDGESRMVPVQADVAHRLMANFSLEEIQDLFEKVARCSLNPNEERLCKILEEQKAAEATKNIS